MIDKSVTAGQFLCCMVEIPDSSPNKRTEVENCSHIFFDSKLVSFSVCKVYPHTYFIISCNIINTPNVLYVKSHSSFK